MKKPIVFLIATVLGAGGCAPVAGGPGASPQIQNSQLTEAVQRIRAGNMMVGEQLTVRIARHTDGYEYCVDHMSPDGKPTNACLKQTQPLRVPGF